MSQYFICISIGELQQWLVDDELPVLTGRIIHSRKSLDILSSGSDLENLFKSLPTFSMDDLAGVLIAEIGGPQTWQSDDEPNIRHLSLSDVQKFIPLSEDAKIALGVRWSKVIELSEAVFEQHLTHFRIRKKSISAQMAGNLFVNLFIDYGSKGFVASSLFSKSLPRALMAAEHHKFEEIEKFRDCRNERLPETWVERTFGDVRRYDKENRLVNLKNKPANLRSIAVVGLLFSTVDALKELTDKCRSIFGRLEGLAKGHDPSLSLIYADPELAQLQVNFNVISEGGESISLVTLGLFLRWKQAFHDQRSAVDVQLMLNDVNSLVGSVDVNLVANALWMMGAYIGMENITPTYRHLHQEKYPALRFSSNEKFLRAVTAWRLELIKQPVEPEFSAGSVSDSVDNKNPEIASPFENISVTNEAHLSDQQERKYISESTQTTDREEHTAHIADQPTENLCTGESPEHISENVLSSAEAELGSFVADKMSTGVSNKGVESDQQAAPSASLVSEEIAVAESGGSLQAISQASSSITQPKDKKPIKKKSPTNLQIEAATIKKSTSASNNEGGVSKDSAEPEGRQGEQKDKSESGENGQAGLPFSEA